MPHSLTIGDDLDLEKIERSGQCFRVSSTASGLFRFIADDDVLYMRKLTGDGYEVSCSASEWDGRWSTYLDMGTSYSEARARCEGRNAFVDRAISYGTGLRILQQDPWEMLITFIISQRKNMPAIANAVETISRRFGEAIADAPDPRELGWDGEPFIGIAGTQTTTDVTIHAFPTAGALASCSEQDLRDCGLGYRAPYILETARMVEAGALDLIACADLADDELVVELKRAHGVGDKVANCIALFGYGRLGNVPIDVWIARAIDEECDGCDPFAQYGDDAGIVQQYVFYYMTQRDR